MITPPYMAMLQFMVVLSTGVASGKNANMKTGMRKINDRMFITIP